MESQRSHKRKKIHLERADLAVATVDNLDLAAIFLMFTNAALHAFFEHIGKLIFFPIAAGASIIRAALALREAHLRKWKSRPTVRFAVEGIAAIGITFAVIAGFLLPSLVAPLIFTGMTVFKALYNAGSCFYYLGKASVTTDTHKKKKYRQRAIIHGAATVGIAVAAVGIASVFIFGKVALAACAIAGGIFGAALAMTSLIRTFTNRKADKHKRSDDSIGNKPSSEDDVIYVDEHKLAIDAKKVAEADPVPIPTVSRSPSANAPAIRKRLAIVPAPEFSSSESDVIYIDEHKTDSGAKKVVEDDPVPIPTASATPAPETKSKRGVILSLFQPNNSPGEDKSKKTAACATPTWDFDKILKEDHTVRP